MQERIVVKNFFSLKDIDIEISKYNIYIGEQSSGKSLLMKLIYFFRVHINGAKAMSFRLDQPINIQKRWIYILFKRYFEIESVQDDFLIQYIWGTENDQMIITLSRDENILVEVVRNGIKKRDTTSDVKDIKDMTSQELFQYDDNLELARSELKKTYILQIYGNYFIPAQRASFANIERNTFNDLRLDMLMQRFGNSYMEAKEKFSPIDEAQSSPKLKCFEDMAYQIMLGRYTRDGFNDRIVHDDYTVKLINSSSGQQQFLPLYLTLRYYLLLYINQDCDSRDPKVVYRELRHQEPELYDYLLDTNQLETELGNLYVEEPEMHLYPKAQADICELLVYVTNVTNSEGLFITTHSPYILAALDNLIYAQSLKNEIIEGQKENKQQQPQQKKFNLDALVDFDQVRAYFIDDGMAKDLRDQETRLIVADDLDSVSEENSAQFDYLLKLKPWN